MFQNVKFDVSEIGCLRLHLRHKTIAISNEPYTVVLPEDEEIASLRNVEFRIIKYRLWIMAKENSLTVIIHICTKF
jgi:hypothetical protein